MILHPTHGLNPTLSKCIICGEDTGVIALLGNSYKEEAPKYMVTSLEPCKKCRETYLKKGVMMAEATYDQKPTGNIVVITNAAFKRMFNQSLPSKKIALCDQEVFKKFKV